MSVPVKHVEAVRKASNLDPSSHDDKTREHFAEYVGRKGQGIRALGSRVTTRQIEAVAAVITPAPLKVLSASEEAREALRVYALTGDASQLSGEQNEALAKVVGAAREYVAEHAADSKAAESQKRRIWPRKVAAIIANYDATPPPKPEPQSEDTPSSPEPDGNGAKPLPKQAPKQAPKAQPAKPPAKPVATA